MDAPDAIARARLVQRLFDEAFEHPPEARAAFLDRACAGDPDLRREVDSLIRAFEAHAGEVRQAFERLVPGLPPAGSSAEGRLVGRRIGPYQVLKQIGRGGMGEVYLALREQPFRQYVALKLIRHSLEAPELERRFALERQILASLNHPGVARLLDGGTTEEGLAYLVMEYVEGRALTRFCDERLLGLEERLVLFEQVCRVVHYAHQNLVVHRDLKPSNILVTEAGQVKLLDFGMAKLLNPALSGVEMPVTQALHRMMTPEYASPEQVRGEGVTTSTDVYALGVLLYELLTGRRPYRFETGSAVEIERVICEQEPERPSSAVPGSEAEQAARVRGLSVERLGRQLRGDLDNIVLKALRKEPHMRYSSAEQLAAEVQRYLAGLPVEARPGTVRYRIRKFVHRHRVAVGAATLGVLTLVGALGVTVGQMRLARAERDRAEAALDRSEAVTAFLAGLFEASDPQEAQGETLTSFELLERGLARIDGLVKEPLVQAQMLSVMGQVYRNLGRYGQAQPLLDRALALRRDHLGEPHLDVARSLTHLATLHLDQGEHEAAEALYREALAMQRQLVGEMHPDVARSLNLLATVFRYKGNYDEAESLYTRALNTYQSLGEEHPDEASVMNNLAMLLRQKGEYAAAEGLHRRALDAQRRQLGETHPYVATSLSNLAVTLYFQSEFDAAEPMARGALALRQKLFGQEHPSVATSLNLLALILQARGELGTAESLYVQALAMRRKLLGEEHPDVALSLQNLAMLLGDKKAYAPAEALHRQALTMRRKLLGNHHPDVATSLWRLASVLHEQGRFSEAEAHYLEALTIFRSQFDEGYVGVQTIYRRLIELYEAWGRPEQAARYRAQLHV